MNNESTGTKIATFLLSIPLLALMLVWYQHLLMPCGLNYSQCCLISCALAYAIWAVPAFRWVWQFALPLAMILQCLVWCGVCRAPLWH